MNKKKRGLTQEDFDTLTEIINLINLENTKNNKGSLNIIIPDHYIVTDHVKIELTPGVYELTEINNAIKLEMKKIVIYQLIQKRIKSLFKQKINIYVIILNSIYKQIQYQ